MKSKGQVWVQDAIVALIIISATAFIFILNYSNISQSQNDFKEVYHQNHIISEYLMLEGTPTDWNGSNVMRLGIVNSDYTLNETKLDQLYNLSKERYDDSRGYLGTRFDYLIFFTDNDDNLLNLTEDYFIGKEGMNNTNIIDIDTETISKTERYLVRRTYEGSKEYKDIIRMIIYSWE